jgi:hypothetical protein
MFKLWIQRISSRFSIWGEEMRTFTVEYIDQAFFVYDREFPNEIHINGDFWGKIDFKESEDLK